MAENGDGEKLVCEPGPYFDPYADAGDEVSSTYEGRHVNMIEDYLLHADHEDGNGDDFVRKGDPVWCMDIIGVALMTGTSEDDIIPIDTEGIWRLPVICSGNIFQGIWTGQALFIDWDGTITDDIGDSINYFGYALEDYSLGNGGPDTVVMAVKVHTMFPPMWMFF